MAPARSFQDEEMDRNACDAVFIDSLRTDTGTGIRRMDGAFGSDIGKRRIRRNICAYFVCRADSTPGTVRYTRTDTFGNTCRYPRADSCPYAGTHSSADGRTCAGADRHELWCRAL